MTSNANGGIKRSEKLKHVEEMSLNWVVIIGGAMLSTLSIRLCCKLKQMFEVKRLTKTQISSKGISDSASGGKFNTPFCPVCKDGDNSLPMVKVPSAHSIIDNGGATQASLLDCFEFPLNPFNHPNSLNSSCVSESGSEVYNKRDVVQKLQQQIRRRDDMIIEMQAQITYLQNSLNVQTAHTTHLQAQLDSSYRELFDSQREVQRIRKAIADHCACMNDSLEKPLPARYKPSNGYASGHHDDSDVVELICIGAGRARGEVNMIEMLRKSVKAMKEVIEGKDDRIAADICFSAGIST